MCLCARMLALKWKERAFIEKVNSRWFCWFPEVYKGAWNVSANNSETVGHKDLRLGQIVYKYISLLQHFVFLASSTGRFPIYFFARASALLRNIQNIRIWMGKRTYRFRYLRKWKDFNKRQQSLIKMCVTSLLCSPWADLWPFYGFLCKRFSLYIKVVTNVTSWLATKQRNSLRANQMRHLNGAKFGAGAVSSKNPFAAHLLLRPKQL